KNFIDKDVILMIVKNFTNNSNPEEELYSLCMELIYHDIEKIERIIENRKKTSGEIDFWEKCLEFLKKEKFLKDTDINKEYFSGTELLTIKEIAVFLNGNEKEVKTDLPVIRDLNEIYKKIIEILRMITFYTVKGNIASAWIIPKGTIAKKAGGKIHKDIEKGFIKAGTLSFEEFIEIGDWHKAKNMGILKFLGPNSEISDGDVVEFYFTR
ncbi:MAG: DUF933 domain-containing protein, partial [candidate division WOR-3 bacterium]